MTDNLVQYETDGGIAIITMNRPEKLNAVNHELRYGVSEALIRADDDKSIHVVILRSNGRAFCVGYDIDSDTPERAARRFDALKWRESLTEDLRFEMIPWYMRKPVVASVQGHALGGGCELAMFCDIPSRPKTRSSANRKSISRTSGRPSTRTSRPRHW